MQAGSFPAVNVNNTRPMLSPKGSGRVISQSQSMSSQTFMKSKANDLNQHSSHKRKLSMKLSQPQLGQAAQPSEMAQSHPKTVGENWHSASAPKKSSAAAQKSGHSHITRSQQKSLKAQKCQDAIVEEPVEDSAQNTKRQSMENANSHRTKENISDFVGST